ncbi:MAG: hypothetical protein U0836_11140 [Pirellulales bacterium]
MVLTGESIPFAGVAALGGDEPGATIAFVDFFGTADLLSIYTETLAPGDIKGFLGTGLAALGRQHPSPQSEPGGRDEIRRRALKLLVDRRGLGRPNFQGGAGPWFKRLQSDRSPLPRELIRTR